VIIIIIILAVLLAIFVALREVKAPATEAPKPAAGPQNQPSSAFRGPTGPPHIIGPKEPPPTY